MKKIMFNDRFELTQAVLEGRKTQTRRIVTPRIIEKYDDLLEEYQMTSTGCGCSCSIVSLEDFLLGHSPCKIGEVVAIAQRYSHVYSELLFDWAKHNYHLVREMSAEKFREKYEHHKGWENKMFVKPELMPHQVKITKVRLQRLQEITDEECLLEGIEKEERTDGEYNYISFDAKRELYVRSRSPREAYSKLIDTLSGKGTWSSNPYVFVYDFELLR